MSLLHDYFNIRNLQLFQRLLESSGHDRDHSTGPSTSTGKKHGVLNVDVNARDWLGRTVLHLASTSVEHLDYVRALLKHPAIAVNLPDVESHWTPLHRALYSANLPATRLLLQRPDIDITLKDNEGYTAFDLYNSTLTGTKPSVEEGMAQGDLFTWGTNSNAALGLGDGNDRVYPEQVIFQHKEGIVDLEKQDLSTRFLSVRVKCMEMSKLHTAVITSETGGNLRMCGFGSGGRLGSNSHIRYDLKPLSQFSQTIISIALGQDHTLALTRDGEVLSWGLNRFAQLGYPVDLWTGGRIEEPIQFTPKKVQGSLKKEVVKGVATSKCASACWTKDSVYTWGTNNGQLGYDRVAQPVQVLPRKVSGLTAPVIAISMTENAMACLMQNRQVECFYNGGHHRINFPTNAFPSPMRPYRPPQAVKDSLMAKITGRGDTFASLSHHGEVYLFSPSGGSGPDSSGKETPFKCQRVWALRKESSAVKDVALGADGSIIICTESGHVFLRNRNVKPGQSGKAFKFQRVPLLQRVAHVYANASGAFGALRVDFKPKPIEIRGNMIWQDIAKIQSFIQMGKDEDPKFAWMRKQSKGGGTELEPWTRPGEGWDSDIEDLDAETEDGAIGNDIRTLREILDTLVWEEAFRKEGKKPEELKLLHGADTLVQLPSGAVFPVHAVVLAARSEVFCKLLSSSTKKTSFVKDDQQNIRISRLPPLRRAEPGPGPGARALLQLSFTGCQPLSVLTLLSYCYSDNVIAVWDRRVSAAAELYAKNHGLKFNPALIKADLQGLARALELPELLRTLERPVKVSPVPTMARDMEKLFNIVQSSSRANLPPPLVLDVILELEDKEVHTHSAILRARSEFFQSFFDEPDWTRNRWDEDGVVRVNLRHLKWRAMEFVLMFMCCGKDAELFEKLEFVRSVDDVLEFMFEVMGAANELLLDRLVLLCSDVILTYSNLHNACYVLADATYYDARQLIDRIQSYITANMELFLEGHMLDDISPELVLQLARFAMDKQKQKAPVVRGNRFVERAMQKHQGWLSLQDIPVPFIRSNKPWPTKKPMPLPIFKRLPSADDVFIMDDVERLSPAVTPSVIGGPAWKAYVAPKVDMKAVMAETAASQIKPSPNTKASRSPPHETKNPLQSPSLPRTPWKQPAHPPPAPSSSLMGPTIAPTRLSPSSSTGTKNLRNASGSSKAWTNRVIEPVAPSSPSDGKKSGGVSLVAIQQSQKEAQSFMNPAKDRRSLLEIQEEEEARRQEEEFLRWWAEEEARVKMEMGAFAQDADGVGRGQRKQQGKRGGKGPRGGGRGLSGGDQRGGDKGKGRGKVSQRKEEKSAPGQEERVRLPTGVDGIRGSSSGAAGSSI